MRQITGNKGIWSLVNQFDVASPDLNTKIEIPHRTYRTELREGISKDGEHSSSEHEDSLQVAASHWMEIRELIDRLEAAPDFEAIKRLARLAYDVRRSDCFRALLKRHYQRRHHFS